MLGALRESSVTAGRAVVCAFVCIFVQIHITVGIYCSAIFVPGSLCREGTARFLSGAQVPHLCPEQQIPRGLLGWG